MHRLEDAVLLAVDEGALLLRIFPPQQEDKVSAILVQPVDNSISQLLPTLHTHMHTCVTCCSTHVKQVSPCLRETLADAA